MLYNDIFKRFINNLKLVSMGVPVDTYEGFNNGFLINFMDKN